MKLTIINGSPKPGINNTQILLDKFIEGYKATAGNEVEIIRVNNEKASAEAAVKFEKAEAVLLAFPLYVYAMPAIVKTFIEELEPLLGKCAGKKIAFLVQYGFHEATHARPLEQYLTLLSQNLGCDYLGTIIKGGCDSLYKKIDIKGKQSLQGIFEIGKTFGSTKSLNQEQLDKYSKPETQKKQNVFILKIIFKVLNKIYWEAAFKKNGVSYKGSFAKPYGN